MPERTADGDHQLPDLEPVRLADRRSRQSRGVHLHDGQVGERVDAVDGSRQDAAVLELDVELLAALHHVVVGQDPAVAVEDDAGPDTGRGDDAEIAGAVGAGDRDAYHGRADLGGHGDRRRGLIDRDGLERSDVGRRGRLRHHRTCSVEGAGRTQGEHRATGGEQCREQRYREQRSASGPAGRGSGRARRGGRRGRLVPAFRCDRWRRVPRTRPIGARLGSWRVAVGGAAVRFDSRSLGLGGRRGRIGRSGRVRPARRRDRRRGRWIDRRRAVALGQVAGVRGVGSGFVMHGRGGFLGFFDR